MKLNYKRIVMGRIDFLESLDMKIDELKKQTRKETGSFKYDFAYDECRELIYNELKNTTKNE